MHLIRSFFQLTLSVGAIILLIADFETHYSNSKYAYTQY